MKKNLKLNTAFWLLLVLTGSAGFAAENSGMPAAADGKNPKTRPSATVRLNNNPKIPAEWRNPINGAAVDVSNTPGIMVNGSGFKNGHTRVAVYFAGHIAAEGKININSGTFQTLLPLKSPLADPREVTIRVGEDFSQSIPTRLRKLQGKVRRADGSAVGFPLVTSGLYRRSDFFVTTVGDESGKFEILVPEKLVSISIFENNSSKTQLECRNYDPALKEGSGPEICMEPHLKFFPGH